MIRLSVPVSKWKKKKKWRGPVKWAYIFYHAININWTQPNKKITEMKKNKIKKKWKTDWQRQQVNYEIKTQIVATENHAPYPHTLTHTNIYKQTHAHTLKLHTQEIHINLSYIDRNALQLQNKCWLSCDREIQISIQLYSRHYIGARYSAHMCFPFWRLYLFVHTG